MALYEVTLDGTARLRFEVDLRVAEAPIRWVDADGVAHASPLRADQVLHNRYEAASQLNRWLRRQGRGAWGVESDAGIEVREITAEG